MIELNGSRGEGGGQIFRSALTLSLVTGRPFRIREVRGRRRRPGLLRQHLTALRLAAEIGSASVEGDALGSDTVVFAPTGLSGGTYSAAVGSAGSAMLVLQTVLPALVVASSPSRVTVQGGTHNPWSPSFHFIHHAWAPKVAQMGGCVGVELHRPGFFPAGGGRVDAEVKPIPAPLPLVCTGRGPVLRRFGHIMVSGMAPSIAHRQRRVLLAALGRDAEVSVEEVSHPVGPGNALWVAAEYEGGVSVFGETGRVGRRAESVAQAAVDRLVLWESSGVPVGPHLADQLVLLMAIAGAGRIRTGSLTSHTRTNLDVVARFLSPAPQARDLGQGVWEIAL